MTFHELIHLRESIRNYDPDRQVEKKKLNRILDAGRFAPSASNRQPWRFYLISSREYLERVQTFYAPSWFSDAPHVLIVAGKRSEAWIRQADGYNSLETDLTIVMDHLILAAEAEGVGSCWIAAFDPEKLKQSGILGPDEEVFAMTPLGYPREGFVKRGIKKRKPLSEVVKFL